MLVERLNLRDFRSYERAQLELGPTLTVISGANGAGKTNLLEALYFACTGLSCRTKNEREVLRFGAEAARLELFVRDDLGRHEISVGFAPKEKKRFRVDGASTDRLLDHQRRPLVSVFMPDRLDLLIGPPALRRAHLDQVVAALWPTRSSTRRAYSSALAQRNALVGQVRGRSVSSDSFAAWNQELARHGVALMRDRAELVDRLRPLFTDYAAELGLVDPPELAYRPRSQAQTADELARELEEHTARDIETGFTTHGPHRDELKLRRAGRGLRAFGSRGQLRLALLALLLAERHELAQTRGRVPLMLLDEAMSELDNTRRRRLVDLLCKHGQSLITTTDLQHVPVAHQSDVVKLRTIDGQIHRAGIEDSHALAA